MTPDNLQHLKANGGDEHQPRARQKTILELRILLASLAQERMVLLEKGALEISIDVNGTIYLELNEHAKGIVMDDALTHTAGA